MESVIVRLDENDKFWISAIAHARNDPKENLGLRGNSKAPKVREYVTGHKIGLAGEFAAARYLCGDVDKTISIRGDAHSGDLKLITGDVVEVKTRAIVKHSSHLPEFALNSENVAEMQGNFGILAYYRDSLDIELCGWFSREDFHLKSEVKRFGSYGVRRVMPNNHLLPMENLRNKINTGAWL